MLPYTLEDFYVELLQISHDNFIIVEGEQDQEIFRHILDKLREEHKGNSLISEKLSHTQVEYANVSGTGQIGQRANVEVLCAYVAQTNFARSLVGFCDREDDGFEVKSHSLVDVRNKQLEQGLVVYSLGHSIENYFFVFDILEEMFKQALKSPENYTDVWKRISDNLKEIFICGTALSCTIAPNARWSLERTYRYLNELSSSKNYSMISFREEKLQFDAQKWFAQWDRYQDDAEEFIDKYKSEEEICRSSDLQTLLLRCHGHIGESIIWWFTKAIIANYDITHQLPSEHSFKNKKRWKRYVNCWYSKKSPANPTDTPYRCFQKLGIEFPVRN